MVRSAKFSAVKGAKALDALDLSLPAEEEITLPEEPTAAADGGPFGLLCIVTSERSEFVVEVTSDGMSIFHQFTETRSPIHIVPSFAQLPCGGGNRLGDFEQLVTRRCHREYHRNFCVSQYRLSDTTLQRIANKHIKDPLISTLHLLNIFLKSHKKFHSSN